MGMRIAHERSSLFVQVRRKLTAQLRRRSAQRRNRTRLPGCSAVAFNRGFRRWSEPMSCPVRAAIEPKDWPLRTVQYRGPKGFGGGSGTDKMSTISLEPGGSGPARVPNPAASLPRRRPERAPG